MKEPLILTDADKASPLWHKLMRHWEDRLSELRAKNEGDLGERETANYRGRIAEVRAMLEKNKAHPIID